MKSTTTRLSLALLATLVLAHSTTSGTRQVVETTTTAQSVAVLAAEADVAGAGHWSARLVCIGCIGAALLSGGASVAGLIALAIANPGITAFCIGACASA